MVEISMMKTQGEMISCEANKETVISININQRSCLDNLLDIIKSVRTVKKDGKDNTTTKLTHSREPLLEGVLFIILGCFNVMLGVIIAVVQPDLDINDFSAHFWVGFPFIVSGVLNIVAYKNPKTFWVVVLFISLLVCLAVTIAGLVFVHRDVTNIWWRNDMAPLCDEVRRSHPYYREGSLEYYNDHDAGWKLERCKSGFRKYQDLLFGLVVMSSIIIACGLSICIITLHHNMKIIFSSCKCEKAEREKVDPLLSPNPTQDIII
ncbi:uncharacterized protein ACMZJ9_015002 [Mantella aurantiaca]